MEPETQSEAPGWRASSSVVDTKSEPPGYIFGNKQAEELKRRKHTVPLDAPATTVKTLLSSTSSSSVFSAQRCVITSSSENSLKLDRKLSQASHMSGGSRQTKKSRSVAAGSRANSQQSSMGQKSKSSSTSSSKKSSMRLGQLLPKATCVDPPTYDCCGFRDSTTRCNTKKSTVSSRYSSSTISNSNDVVQKENHLDTIELDSKSEPEGCNDEEYDEKDSNTKGSEFSPELGQDLVVREDSSATDSEEYALVEYEESTTQCDEEVGGVILPAKNRYLAAAVDNYGAMVPLNSDVYEAYDHTFISCPEHLRFRFLYTFLKRNLDKKIVIFFSTTDSALFHSKLLDRFHIPVLTMHSRQNREKFINTFLKFSDLGEGILCTTDAAGRDLDIPPSVDYVLQFEPPDDPSEFILRVARISCDSLRIGRSILFLNPGETGFLKYYVAAAIPVSEFELPRLADVQSKIESRVNNDAPMLQCAKNAYRSYLIAHASHGFRDVYNVHDLNKADVAAAFGLISIPGGDDDDGGGGGEEEEESDYAGRNGRSTQKVVRKTTKQDWMKGKKKIWPHCRVKVHPSFNGDKNMK